MTNSKTKNAAGPRYFVAVTDDEGTHVAFAGHRTPEGAALAVASVYEGVNAAELARKWSAHNESGSTYFEIGQEE
jgi:hypothetical protein